MCRYNILHHWRNWVYIINKDRKKVLFRLNDIQQQYQAEETDEDIILKSRKVGISTYKVLQGFHDLIFVPYTISVVICHINASTDFLYDKLRFAYDHLPEFMKPEPESFTQKKVLLREDAEGRDLHSSYQIGTAGSVDYGRGGDISRMHLSEYAFYPNPDSIKSGVMQACVPGAKKSIESTANAYNDFYNEWERAKAGESSFKPHFFGWIKDPDCRMPIIPSLIENLNEQDQKYAETLKLDNEQKTFYFNKRDREGLGKEKTWQEFPATDLEAFVASAQTVFDIELINKLGRELEARREEAKHSDEPFIQETGEEGSLTIWSRPVERWRYVIGADASKGVPGGDYSCAEVLDNESGEQVAELHGRWPVDIFAEKLDKLGRRYNNALLIIEYDRYGAAVVERMYILHHYPNLYYDRKFDKVAKKWVAGQLGWIPTPKSKTQVITELQSALRQKDITINSEGFLAECRTFVHITTKSMGAEPGRAGSEQTKRDDRVISTAIATHALLKFPWLNAPKKPEEYANADVEWAHKGTKMMEKRWAKIAKESNRYRRLPYQVRY